MPNPTTPKDVASIIAAGPSSADALAKPSAAQDVFEPLPTSAPPNVGSPVESAPKPPVKPQLPQERGDVTPPNVDLSEESSVGDVLNAFDRLGIKKQDDPKKSAQPKEVETPTPSKEPNAEEKEQKEDGLLTVEFPTAVSLAQTDENNVEQLPEVQAEIPAAIAKQMSNPAKEWAVSQLKQNAKYAAALKAQQAEANKPSQAWYEHPNAYALTPEFQRSVGNANQYRAILRHYQEQLLAVRDGEEWIDLTENEKGEAIRIPTKQKPSTQAELLLEERIATARELIREEEQQQQNYIAQHQQYGQQSKTLLQDLEKRYFPQYEKGIVTKSPQIKKYLEDAAKQLTLLRQQHNPLTGFVLRLYASFLETKLAPTNAVAASAAASQATQRQAGPTNAAINSAGATKPLDPDEQPFNPNQWPGNK